MLMTTLTLQLNLPDETAQDLRQLSQSAGQTEAEFLSAQVIRLARQMRSYHEVRMSSSDLHAIQEELRPYREASAYQSEADFLNQSR